MYGLCSKKSYIVYVKYKIKIERNGIMKTQNGFTLLENAKDVRNWLAKQNVTRTITRLQVHHMDAPSYSTWEKTDKKVFTEPHFGRTQSLNDYGKRTWGSGASDGHGHYIAQHFNVFPDGKITTGRNLNSTPIGIRGWNTNAICVEIYGKFDKGHDVMNAKQKEAVIYLYGELCKRFDIPVNTSHIRPHCWFTAGGTYLGKYNPSRSAKTCPGTNFWGTGCSTSGFGKFIADVKAYVNGKAPVEEKPKETKVNKEGKVNVSSGTVNVRKSYDADSTKLGELKDNAKVKIVATVSNGWLRIKYKDGYGYVNSKYIDGIKDVVVEEPKVEKPKEEITTYYRVAIGSYEVRDNAVEEQEKAISKGYKDTFLVADTVNGEQLFRVVVDSFKSKDDADKLVDELKKKGFDPFISIYKK